MEHRRRPGPVQSDGREGAGDDLEEDALGDGDVLDDGVVTKCPNLTVEQALLESSEFNEYSRTLYNLVFRIATCKYSCEDEHRTVQALQRSRPQDAS